MLSDTTRRDALCEALRLMTEAEELVRAGEPRAKELLVQAEEAIAKSNSGIPPALPNVTLREVAVQRFRALLKQLG